LLQFFSTAKSRMKSSVLNLLENNMQRIDDLRSNLDLSIKRNLREKKLALLSLEKQKVALEPRRHIQNLKQKLNILSRSLIDARLLEQIRQKKQRLQQLISHLRGIDPKNLLTKGYCILFQEKKDSVILSSSELKAQERVRLQLHDGKALLT